MRNPDIASFTALLLALSLPAASALGSDESLSIVHLAFRDHIVTIHSSQQGPRYSVRTTSGELLGENLTDEELLAAHPELHSRVRSSYASDTDEGFIWAGQSDRLVEPARDAVVDPE